VASMRSRSRSRMRISRSWLSRAARTGGFDANLLAFACGYGRLDRRREWATSAETAAVPAAAQPAAIATHTDGRIPDKASAAAANPRAAVPVPAADDLELLSLSTGAAASRS